LLRNSSIGSLWIEGSLIPVTEKGGGKQNSLFDIARGRRARARTD